MTVAVPAGLSPEAVLVAIGLESVLGGSPKFGEVERAKAIGLPKEINRAVRDFLASANPGPSAALPPFDWEEFTALLEADVPEREERLFEVLPGDLGIEVMNLAVRIQQQMLPMVQRTVRRTSVAVETLPPSESEEAAIARTWSVAADPMIVFANLEDWSLSEDMAAALREFYPEINGVAQAAVDTAVDARRARSATWDLSYDQDAVLRTLTGIPEDRPMLTADYEQLYADSAAQQAAAAAPARRSSANEPGALETPGQRP